MKMTSKIEITSKMKMTSIMKMTSKIIGVGGLSSQIIFSASDTSKSCKWHSSIGNSNYSGSGRDGSGRLSSVRFGPIVIISQPAELELWLG